jgi:hypothetical protein
MVNCNKIPVGEICYKCGNIAVRRERDTDGVKTGKYICDKCYKLKHRYGTYEKHERHKKRYNDENRCEFVEPYGKRCDEQLHTKNVRRFDIDGKCVWYCIRHGNRYYQRHNPNSQNNKKKAEKLLIKSKNASP